MKKTNFLKLVASSVLTVSLSLFGLAGCGGQSANSGNNETSGTIGNTQVSESGEVVFNSESAPASSEHITIRFADQPGFIPVLVAQEKGFFDEQLSAYNASVELIEYTGGGPAINESFVAGEIEYAIIGDLPVASANANGIDTKIIAYSATKGGDDVLVVRSDSGIESVADLKGKKIGVAVGQISHGELIKILQNAGLTENDVEIVNLSNTDSIAALTAGEIDAAQNYLTVVASAIENGAELSTIANAEGLGFSNIVFAARGDFARENPEITVAVLKALQQAVDYLNENKDDSVAIAAAASGRSEAVMSQIYDVYDQHLELGDKELSDIQNVLDFAYANSLITVPLTTDDIVDRTYIEQIGE